MITITAITLTTIGALNWLIVGLFDYNIISSIFSGEIYWIARVIYSLVGVAGIWSLIYLILNRFNAKKINAIEESRCHCQDNKQ